MHHLRNFTDVFPFRCETSFLQREPTFKKKTNVKAVLQHHIWQPLEPRLHLVDYETMQIISRDPGAQPKSGLCSLLPLVPTWWGRLYTGSLWPPPPPSTATTLHYMDFSGKILRVRVQRSLLQVFCQYFAALIPPPPHPLCLGTAGFVAEEHPHSMMVHIYSFVVPVCVCIKHQMHAGIRPGKGENI